MKKEDQIVEILSFLFILTEAIIKKSIEIA